MSEITKEKLIEMRDHLRTLDPPKHQLDRFAEYMIGKHLQAFGVEDWKIREDEIREDGS